MSPRVDLHGIWAYAHHPFIVDLDLSHYSRKSSRVRVYIARRGIVIWVMVYISDPGPIYRH